MPSADGRFTAFDHASVRNRGAQLLSAAGHGRHSRSMKSLLLAAFAVLMGFYLAGCNTTPKLPAVRLDLEPQTLQPGDTIKIVFPGSPNLDTTQQVRRDGKINLYLAGEVVASDKTPTQLEQELMKIMGSQLVSKEVNVTVLSSSFSVFVIGAVMKPGKITPDRAITALEAIVEAGGFDYAKADTKGVVVMRQEDGKTKRFTLNLKAVFDGKNTELFYLKSRDIVYVPEKFNWF